MEACVLFSSSALMIVDLINKVGKDGITEEELEAARQKYLKVVIDMASTNERIAMMLARLSALSLDFDYYDKALKRIQSITREELNGIAKKYFNADGMIRVEVGRV